MSAGGDTGQVGIVSLNDIKANLKEYIKSVMPDGRYDNFTVNEVYDGWFGSKFRATRMGLELYQTAGENISRPVKIAELGLVLKVDGKLQKAGSTYAEETTVKGEDKKHHIVYSPDRDKSPADRIFGESKLVKLVRSRSNGITPPATGLGLL